MLNYQSVCQCILASIAIQTWMNLLAEPTFRRAWTCVVFWGVTTLVWMAPYVENPSHMLRRVAIRLCIIGTLLYVMTYHTPSVVVIWLGYVFLQNAREYCVRCDAEHHVVLVAPPGPLQS